MRKPRYRAPATSLSDAIQRCVESGEQQRRPAKVMAELMGVELKTYYRWLAENSMPLHRVRQFEEFTGCNAVSDYLAVSGGRVVIDIPLGRKCHAKDVLDLQASFGEAMALLVRHYQEQGSVDDTLGALTALLRDVAWHRENVARTAAPELDLF